MFINDLGPCKLLISKGDQGWAKLLNKLLESELIIEIVRVYVCVCVFF